MDLGLKDRVAIVTGGSRGIGRSIALQFAKEGCHVAICARGEEKLRETEAELQDRGVKVVAAPVDVTDANALEAFVAQAPSDLGRVDALVNNAGGNVQVDADAAWLKAIDLNLMAAVRAPRAVLPHMRAAGGGAVVNITSIWGREGGGPPI